MTLSWKAARSAVVAASLATALAVSTQSALASHYEYVYHGSDYAVVNGGWVGACDMERDGNGVYIDGYLTNGTYFRKGDGNGSAGGCGNATFTVWVDRFRVCEDLSGRPDSCSAWRYYH